MALFKELDKKDVVITLGRSTEPSTILKFFRRKDEGGFFGRVT